MKELCLENLTPTGYIKDKTDREKQQKTNLTSFSEWMMKHGAGGLAKEETLLRDKSEESCGES